LYKLNRYLNIQAQKTMLPKARYEVLKLIKSNNPVTLSQLCEIQKVKLPTMSKLVDELQDAALVIRAQSKDDARQRWIVPTQKGIQILQEATTINQEFWSQKLANLSEDQNRQLRESLRLLIEMLSPEQDK
ncbi:MAG: MarR family transcriptional regulator, partial [Gammaproteobacteria bacterium]|nr:MarR family transcriptional regulator [Gammaproteobacteria bacterium]